MIAWFRRVYDPWWVFAFWLICMAPLAFLLVLLVWVYSEYPDAEGRRAASIFPGLGLFGFGLWRGVVFHPLFRPDYRRWLESTPWTPDRPLPFGPLQLVWQDLVVAIAFVTPAAFVNGSEAFLVLAVGVLGYLIGSIAAFAYVGPRSHLYPVLALIALAVFAATFLYGLTAPLLMAAYLVTVHGQKRSLEHFPWPEQFPAVETITQLGWPYQQLDTKLKPEQIQNWERPVIGLLVGLTLFVGMWLNWISINPVLIQHGYFDVKNFAAGCLIPLFGVLLVTRLIWMIYCAPPISFWGRLAIGRPVIPRYDILFLAPILAFLLMIPLPWSLIDIGLHPLAAYPICALLGTTAFLICPPRYAEWRLTVPCRLTIYSVKDATSAAKARRPGATPATTGVRVS